MINPLPGGGKARKTLVSRQSWEWFLCWISSLSASQANELSSTFSFHFRNCQIGEYYENKVCRICPNGTYSLHENSQLEITTCQRCPSSALQIKYESEMAIGE
jgi:hypothetical protein